MSKSARTRPDSLRLGYTSKLDPMSFSQSPNVKKLKEVANNASAEVVASSPVYPSRLPSRPTAQRHSTLLDWRMSLPPKAPSRSRNSRSSS
jgi:hypothetical protein